MRPTKILIVMIYVFFMAFWTPSTGINWNVKGSLGTFNIDCPKLPTCGPTAATTPCSVSDCVRIGSQCFTFSEDGDVKEWSDAVDACAAQDGRLATIADPQAVLDYVTQNYGRVGFWVGGSDQNTEGVWKWRNGAQVDASLPWAAGEPNGGGGEDCMAVNGPWGYYDGGCTGRLRYICE